MKIITNLFLMIFLLPASSLAATYCLQKSQSIFKAKKELDYILIAGESTLIDSRNNCLTVAVKEYRKALVDKFIYMNFKVVTKPSEKYVQRRSCNIELKKVKSGTENKRALELGKNVDVRDSISDLDSSSNMQMLLMEGRKGKISVDTGSLEVLCRIVPNGFELTYSMVQNGRTTISSQAFIKAGQWLNVGTVSSNTNNKRDSKSISSGIDYEKVQGNSKTTYFLTVVK